jgi:hypothetical protein
MTGSEVNQEVTIICVAYRRYREIHVLINSILCQTVNNWKLLIIHDGHDGKMEREVGHYTKKYETIEYLETDRRFNDYGHSLREIGIRMVETPYLMMTNDDNYYAPKYLEYMFHAIKEKNLDFVLCNMVSSHDFLLAEKPPFPIYMNLFQTVDGSYKQSPYNVINSIPKKHCIDIGNFIIKSEIAKSVGFREKGFCADGTFVEDVMSLYEGKIRVGKVDKVLFVHN